MKAKLTYQSGDLFKHLADDPPGSELSEVLTIVPHVCNNIGAWGAGFTEALTKFDPQPESSYKEWCKAGVIVNSESRGRREFMLGNVGFISLFQEKGMTPTFVANMIAQKGLISGDNPIPLQYGALGACMYQVAHFALKKGHRRGVTARIFCPQFGCGLAGGQWSIIETMIQEVWVDQFEIPVTVFVHRP